MKSNYYAYIIFFSTALSLEAYEPAAKQPEVKQTSGFFAETRTGLRYIAQDIAKLIILETANGAAQNAAASYLFKKKFTFKPAKLSRFVAPQTRFKIYSFFLGDFLKQYAADHDKNYAQWEIALQGAQSKEELTERLAALLLAHNLPLPEFRAAFRHYKSHNGYHETLKANIKKRTVFFLTAMGTAAQCAGEISIHVSSLLSRLLLNPSNKELKFNLAEYILEALFPSQNSYSNGTMLWRYGLKTSDKTTAQGKLMGLAALLALHCERFYKIYKNETNGVAKLFLALPLFYAVRNMLNELSLYEEKFSKNATTTPPNT